MPAKEIKELRKSGRLEEALAMAQEELDAQPDNIWTKRNISWVYYELLKKHIGDQEEFIIYIKKVKDLELPENETLVFEQISWVIGKHNFEILKSNIKTEDKTIQIEEIFRTLQELKFQPSAGYSFLLKSLHKAFKDSKSFDKKGNFELDRSMVNKTETYKSIIKWWGLDNFNENDYLPGEINGEKTMSLVEQVIIAYSKAILSGNQKSMDARPNDPKKGKKGLNRGQKVLKKLKEENYLMMKDEVIDFIPLLTAVIDSHPEYQYPLYYKAKLLGAIGQTKEARQFLIPFVKMKVSEFWTWELLGELYNENSDERFACYCKALSLRSPDKFLIVLRESFAKLLVQKKLYAEAKTEIEAIIKVRKENKWKLTSSIQNLMESDWYKSATAITDNSRLYRNHLLVAEELIFAETEEHLVIVEFVNKNKKILNFIEDKNTHGFFSYRGTGLKPNTGDLLKVRLQFKGKEGFYKLLTVKEIEETYYDQCRAYKEVSGVVKIVGENNFGFLEDTFISSDLIEKHKLNHLDTAIGKAILSFNKRKDNWGR